MKAVVVTAPGKFQVMDNVPAPQLTEYEALVRSGPAVSATAPIWR